VVVGGGPAGLAAAILAKRNGANEVVVLEKRGTARSRSQVVMLDEATVRDLIHLGLDPYEDGLLTRIEDVSVCDAEGILAAPALLGAHGLFDNFPQPITDVDELTFRRRLHATVSINRLEAALAETAMRQGVRVVFDAEVSAVSQDDDSARVTVGGMAIRADYVVVADGSHSPTSEHLGIHRHLVGEPRRVVGALFSGGSRGLRWRVSGEDSEAPEAFRMGTSEVTSVGVPLPADIDAHDEAAVRAFAERTAKKLGIDAPLVRAPTVFTTQEGRAERVVVGKRIFLVGDAVRSVSPKTGLGINFALRDAVRFGEAYQRLRQAPLPFFGDAVRLWYEAETQASTARLHTLSALLGAGAMVAKKLAPAPGKPGLGRGLKALALRIALKAAVAS
jgi:2-polyprenyl-6-methoxyphenol hydroxylase-like FAD-dependent oxidoreductase